ncbi:MAG: glycosyltransferase, partial [Candidatus Omnitrophica bacterium]|nr:glycosyltransferase [Candidatus Omnitrophota bacterium]
ARRYADKVIRLEKNLGKNYARRMGIGAANGEIVVAVDSDIVIKKDTLNRIAGYFENNRRTDALTGLFSKEHPNKDFFSQYKNLYMHYIFRKLPKRVNFLFGSICAMRRDAANLCNSSYRYGQDTAYGQQLVSHGKNIFFLTDLEVIHLKKYNFWSLLKNDFNICFYWANIFLKFKGWKQLGRNKVGFAHSPVEQLISVCLAPATLLFIPLKLFILCPVLLWVALNIGFLRFLLNESGMAFALVSTFFTFLDNIVMALGITCGFLFGLARAKNRGE